MDDRKTRSGGGKKKVVLSGDQGVIWGGRGEGRSRLDCLQIYYDIVCLNGGVTTLTFPVSFLIH